MPSTERNRAILWGGLIAGSLDLLAAFITSGVRGVGPALVLQSIASGLLGKGSYQGGAGSAALGFFLHFVIAFGATVVYYAASRKLRLLVERPVLCGLLYGIAVYAFMNLVVLPLSAIAFKPSYTPASLAQGLVIHILCVGLPIALAVHRAAKSG